MGCGSSSINREIAEDEENIDNVSDLGAALKSTWKALGKILENPKDKRFWPLLKRLIQLLRRQASYTKETSALDVCIDFLEPIIEDKGAVYGVANYHWALSSIGEVKMERFMISQEKSDIEDAIKYLVLHANESKLTGLEVAVPLSRALKAFMEDSDVQQLTDHKYILETVWPKIKDCNIATHGLRYLGFLWRVQYMQQGDLISLLACRAATKAFVLVTGENEDGFEANLHDLADLEMMAYFNVPHALEFPDATLPARKSKDTPSPAEGNDSASDKGEGEGVINIPALFSPLQKRQIRVVSIEAGEYDDPIRCSLMVISLDMSSTFDAMSYTWEEKDKSRTISINGSSFAVTKTLCDGLRRVRSKSQSRLLWVDAICVNQSDLSEKAVQAGIVRDIYSQAKGVLMYVGEPDDLSVNDPDFAKWFKPEEFEKQDFFCAVLGGKVDVFNWTDIADVQSFFQASLEPDEWPVLGAMCIIYQLSKDTHFGDMPFFSTSDDQPYHVNYAWRKSVLGVLAFFMRPYWHRAWMLQEIAVAKNPVVYYGNTIMPFEYILKAGANAMRHAGDCCESFATGPLTRAEGPLPGDVFPGWSSMLGCFLSLLQPTHYRNMQSLQQNGASVTMKLRDALQNAHIMRQADDPRDLVFSALGLVSNARTDPVKIDYSLSVAEVFSNAAIRVFEDDGNLSMLQSHDDGRDDALKIPSWVPDWRFEFEYESLLGRTIRCAPLRYAQFDASKGKIFHGRVQSDMCLAVQSIKVDRIVAVGSHWISDKDRERDWMIPGGRVQPPESLLSQIAEWRGMAGLPEQTSQSSKDKRFWRTVFADTVSFQEDQGPIHHRRMKDEDLRNINELIEKIRKQEPPAHFRQLFSEAGPNHGSLHYSTVSRRFFVTEQGRFGLGLASPNNIVQIDDEVHVIEGSNLPVVLRPLVDAASQNPMDSLAGSLGECVHRKGPVCQVMGFAYLENCMDGEAVGRGSHFSEVYLR